MRYLLFLTVPLALAAQSAEPDQRITQTLISEIQQLRMAIERSTLLSARTQLAISQLQLQESTIVRVTQQLNEVRMQAPGAIGHKARVTEFIRQTEQQRTTASDALMIEAKLRELKAELEQATALETNLTAREGELAAQLQTAQNQIADSRSRIAEMERALDTAIQQLMKQK
jgi:chromosome segregation ATPase